ncbi:hypothetical protein [Amycolatopsis viridis]|uniref:ESX-1 secretion-associated protein n=1 Tax=Amycolatopsis viridis TaxID=185678 RepID=A0ABX0T0F0_9PSEU|nr:hypothetical protein [Amycolatopsis viridis]NIH82697.1 hypothetical protein [Amycolatopsis viridis]
MSAGSYSVDPAALTRYSGELDANRAAVAQVTGKVGQADVGDKSWGLVGLFVKHQYTELLTDLKDLLKDMENGLGSASAKIADAARAYREADDTHRRALAEIAEQLDDVIVRDLNG